MADPAGRRRQKPARAPKFKLSRVGNAIEDAKKVPARLRPKVTAAIERLAREGCRAADYALSRDPPWPHLCAVHVDGWRILIAFPTEDEVTIMKIASHDAHRDPYREIARELGVPVSIAPRTKPPCCDPERESPVDAQVVAVLQAAFDSLTRRERQGRSQS